MVGNKVTTFANIKNLSSRNDTDIELWQKRCSEIVFSGLWKNNFRILSLSDKIYLMKEVLHHDVTPYLVFLLHHTYFENNTPYGLYDVTHTECSILMGGCFSML